MNDSSAKDRYIQDNADTPAVRDLLKEFHLMLSDPHIPEEVKNALLEGYLGELGTKKM